MVDRAVELERLREVLWDSIGEASVDKRAPLAAQYRATLSELAELSKDAGKAGDPVDEIAARRAARGVQTPSAGVAPF